MTLALRDVNVSAQGAASFLVLLDLSFCFSLLVTSPGCTLNAANNTIDELVLLKVPKLEENVVYNIFNIVKSWSHMLYIDCLEQLFQR